MAMFVQYTMSLSPIPTLVTPMTMVRLLDQDASNGCHHFLEYSTGFVMLKLAPKFSYPASVQKNGYNLAFWGN
jgi:hypothetical protein